LTAQRGDPVAQVRPEAISAYRDEKAFVDCQKILNGIPQDEENPAIRNADRGIALLQFNAGK